MVFNDWQESDTQSYVRFNSGVRVDFVKVQKEKSATDAASFEQAQASFRDCNQETILFNNFQNRVEAEYLSPESYTAGSKYSIYRKTPEQQYYDFLCELGEGDYIVTDYNLTNDMYYHYLATIETRTQGAPVITFFENTDTQSEDYYIHSKWWKWSLCDIEPSSDETVYLKTGTVWHFAYNMDAGTYVQNTAVSAWDTLGQYGKFSIGQKNYDSSTFSCLLGDMDEFYDYQTYLDYATGCGTRATSNNIRKNYKYSEKEGVLTEAQYNAKKLEFGTNETAFQNWVVQQLDNNKYSREVEKSQSWRKFVANGKLKLLKDYKGNSWVIQIMPNSQRMVTLESNYQQTTVSFEWQEALDVNKVTIVSVGE